MKGRKKGTKLTDEQKKKISEGMKRHFNNMTDEQKQRQERINKLKSIRYHEAMKLYYKNLENKLIDY